LALLNATDNVERNILQATTHILGVISSFIYILMKKAYQNHKDHLLHL